MEFRLFGEQYLKFMHFLVPGNFLYIKGKVQQRSKYYKSDEFQKEFRIQQIELLTDLREKLTNKIYLRWDYELIKKKQIQDLGKLFKKFKGKKNIIFELLDRKSNSFITLSTRKYQTNVSNELLNELKLIDGFLGFSINKSGMNMFIRNTLKENEVEELVEVQ